MRKQISAVLSSLALSLFATGAGHAESSQSYAVQVSASVQISPAQITLHWLPDTADHPNNFAVYRRAPGESDWQAASVLPGTATEYTDADVKEGIAYDYQVVETTPTHEAFGYTCSGINLPLTEDRGKLLLVVDNTYASQLAPELARLREDLVGDGWTVERLDVNRDDSVKHVKSLIKARYEADPANVKAVFLFGHVPVPYSGDIVPDGHYSNHQGAWPCDGYYGDMDGAWTDKSVNDTSAADPRNHNVPGDGKFDQSTFPAPIKLMVGRVDLANMPGRLRQGGAATFPNELKLLRNYLNKDHNFRNKITSAPERGIVGDYFGVRDGEAFAASGWRNFAPFFGPDQITTVKQKGTWISDLHSNAYLFAYACGPGSFTSIEGIGHVGHYDDGVTTELVRNDIKAVFTMLYGSWLGDWDSEDNMQRAVLATPSYGLTCVWSGRPHWFLQDMAMGQPIGYSTRLTQNNGLTHLYHNQQDNCESWTHIALMGDPTLRMHVIAPPANVLATLNASSTTLNWLPSSDDILGYNVYRATNPNGPFRRLNHSLVTDTTCTDNYVASSGYTYMVRAVALETSASGSYFNASEGAFSTPAVGALSAAGQSTPAIHASLSPDDLKPANQQHSSDNNSAHQQSRDTAKTAARLTPTGASTGTGANDTVWFDDALPSGAAAGGDGGDGWNWINSNPTPISGSKAHQSNTASGFHQHYFDWAYGDQLSVNAGDVLFAYVYLDPAKVPSEIMLQWNDGSWEHRAYWGANSINSGTDGTVGRRYMGALPAAGQWVRLEVPASQVGLEGSTLKGMGFALYDGRATWDATGKSTAASDPTTGDTNNPPVVDTNTPPVIDTNTPPVTDTNTVPVTTTNPPSAGTNPPAYSLNTSNWFGSTAADDIALKMPKVGATGLHILTPTLLELQLINTKDPDPASVADWNFVNGDQFSAPGTGEFAVTADGQSVPVAAVGFKRRPLYAPLVGYDLRIANSLYLQLATPISNDQTIQVKNPDGSLWGTNMQFTAKVDPLRYSPAIHVNEEGYLPDKEKKAEVGYYLGSMGELNVIPSSGFNLVDANSGNTVFTGNLIQRADVGYVYTPTPYQKVYEADFSSFTTPGTYRLVVPGMGASLPFNINEGVAMDFARTYALGLYHQRCGDSNTLPYTRFTHDACHTAPASVPTSATDFPFTWKTIANYAQTLNADNPPQKAPALTDPSKQLFPFVRTGKIDVSGGHHDAGDYSKYTINCASLVHYLIFAVDSIQGVSGLDNLGIPESGDGISDVMQEAKWEADYISKLQDTDGGFYFIVYPENREYESNVTPDKGDPQVVWPKTSSSTAAAVAALAECASSPLFKKSYPDVASNYLAQAKLGWKFLTDAIAKYGKDGIYQKITHYGDWATDKDELAWAACEMYLATGDPQYQQTLFQWFPDPTDSSTFRWGWWKLYGFYGNAVRSYAFAAKSGRLQPSQLDAGYLAKCVTTLTNAANDLALWSQQSAYGTSFPEATKHVKGAGWYFSGDQTYDLTVAYQLYQDPKYLSAILGNMNYEGGCNPVNVAFVTGLGWKRERDAVSQYAANDRRLIPPDGEPIGNIQDGFSYLGNYGSELTELCFPSDNAGTAPFPFYDRWADSWNVSTEFVTFQQAKSLATYAFLAAQTPLATQPWQAVPASINVPTNTVAVGVPVKLSVQAPGVDLTGARIVWEGKDQEPTMGRTFAFVPKNNGAQWVEAEAQLPDGRRVFAAADFNADSTNLVWVDDTLPDGAQPDTTGGDGWNWLTSNPTPVSGSKDHQSALATGLHQHSFDWATSTMFVKSNTTLYAYVYLDPANPPSEVMLQWNDGTWDHRAYWGANNISYGNDGTTSRHSMGALPAAGKWVQLQVPASQVALEGSTVKGMSFALYNGRATWDAAGLLNTNVVITQPNDGGGGDTGGGPGDTNNTSGTTVTVTGSNASRVSHTPGAFTFKRKGNNSKALTVTYSLAGTAVSGTDYQPPQSTLAVGGLPSVTIPAGADYATVTINPTTATNMTGNQTVVLTLQGGADYAVGSPGSATLDIEGNLVSAPSLTMNGSSGPALSWPSTSGAVYHVFYKNSLSDTNWTDLGTNITASGTNSAWTDPSATNKSRFYLIQRVQ